MPKFKYVAEDANGKKKKGTVEASNEQAATSKISQRGLFPIELTKVEVNKKVKTKKSGAPKVKGKGFSLSFGKPKMKTKALTVFTRQLATLIGAGLPLLRALKTLERQSANAPASFAIISDIAETVEGGAGFAEALGNHPKTFDRLYVNMVKAGEASGNLEEVLERLAEFKEKAARISTKIKSASMYPAVVFSVATLITVGLMLFIVPKFQQIFADMLGKDEPLPPLTQMVVDISEFMQSHYIVILLVVVFVVIGFQLFKKTSGGEYFLHGLVLKLPGVKTLVIKSNVGRFCRTLGTLQKSGVSILQSLKIVHDTTVNRVLAKDIAHIQAEVTEGEPIVKPMSQSKIFDNMVVSMVEVGEETGELPEMLLRVANNYDEEVDAAVDGLISMIEPLLIVFLAVVVGTIVIAMFMPLVSLIENL